MRKGIEKAIEVLRDNSVTNPPVDVFEIANNYGLNILEADLRKEKESPSGILDMDNSNIYVEKTDSPQRKVFTVAHELGHYLMHKEELKSYPEKYAVLYRRPLGAPNHDSVEQDANSFAATLLVPQKMLDRYKKSENPEDENLYLLSKLFGVSRELIGWRISDLYKIR